MRVLWLVIFGTLGVGTRLSKGGRKVLCIWGQTLLGASRKRVVVTATMSTGSSEVSLDPATWSTYKATQSQGLPYRQIWAARKGKEGYPFEAGSGKGFCTESLPCASWKGALTPKPPWLTPQLLGNQVGHPSPLASLNFQRQALGWDIIATS